MKKYKQGTCPYCGAEEIQYFVGELQEDECFDYNCHCHKCKKDFVESYHLVFNSQFDEYGRPINENTDKRADL